MWLEKLNLIAILSNIADNCQRLGDLDYIGSYSRPHLLRRGEEKERTDGQKTPVGGRGPPMPPPLVTPLVYGAVYYENTAKCGYISAIYGPYFCVYSDGRTRTRIVWPVCGSFECWIGCAFDTWVGLPIVRTNSVYAIPVSVTHSRHGSYARSETEIEKWSWRLNSWW